MTTRLPALCLAALSACALSTVAGAAVNVGEMSRQKIALGGGGGGPTGVTVVDGFHLTHVDGFKGAKRVAISAFNVAFPGENTLTANMKAKNGLFAFAAKSSLHTVMTGVDQATQQRIADAAYANFVTELTKAGFDVVAPEEFGKLAPEWETWKPVANFTAGRYGPYVAPSGRRLYWLRADTAKRDTSGALGQMAPAFRGLDSPQAFSRSPYLAHDAKLGIIAVTLVVDYGTYTTTGETGKVKDKPEVTFTAGVTAQSGSFYDSATLLEYWGPNSGGFPALATLAAPLVSDQTFATVEAVEGSGEVAVKAEPAKFEKAADEVAFAANARLIGAFAAAAAH